MDAKISARHAGSCAHASTRQETDDVLGHFLVRISCKCGAHRTADPESLARLSGSSATLESVGKRMRCSKCGTKGAEVVAISLPRPRGRGFPR